MTYQVIRPFKDLRDPQQYEYQIGDIYPRTGYKSTKTFIQELLNGSNSAGSIFLTKVYDNDVSESEPQESESQESESQESESQESEPQESESQESQEPQEPEEEEEDEE